jgi:hypothetical protein
MAVCSIGTSPVPQTADDFSTCKPVRIRPERNASEVTNFWHVASGCVRSKTVAAPLRSPPGPISRSVNDHAGSIWRSVPATAGASPNPWQSSATTGFYWCALRETTTGKNDAPAPAHSRCRSHFQSVPILGSALGPWRPVRAHGSRRSAVPPTSL